MIERSTSKFHINMMIKMFKNHVKELVEDINGNHVIQKSLNCFVAPFNDFIFDEMI